MSEKSITIILNSWRKTTQKQYEVHIKKFINFCSEKKFNVLKPSVNNTIEFLTNLHEKGLGYSSLNSARSALSALYSVLGVKEFGSHPLICRFLKGIFELTPSVPRYKETWDVSLVLNFFKTQKGNEFLSLYDVTQKLCALMLLATAHRLQTIHSIRLSCIHFYDGYVEIEIIDKVKNSKPDIHNSVLKFEKFNKEPKLCVVKTLIEYLTRTSKLRNNEDKLFLCHKKPFQAASKDTISRWIKDLMDKVGINTTTYKPHSFRMAASSAKIKEGMPLEKLLKLAGWASASTFQKFYHRKCTIGQPSQSLISDFLNI